MHYIDSNKTAEEEARRQLHKNAASNLEQVLAQHPTRHQLYSHLWWTIEKSGERGSGIFVLAARHDDDDDTDCIFAEE